MAGAGDVRALGGGTVGINTGLCVWARGTLEEALGGSEAVIWWPALFYRVIPAIDQG